MNETATEPNHAQAILSVLGFEALSQSEQEALLVSLSDAVMERAMQRLILSLNPEQVVAFEHYLESEPDQIEIFKHIHETYPHFADIVKEEANELHEVLADHAAAVEV